MGHGYEGVGTTVRHEQEGKGKGSEYRTASRVTPEARVTIGNVGLGGGGGGGL